jgi:hypothetical protein
LATVACSFWLLVEFVAVPIRNESFALPIPAAEQWLSEQPKPFVVAEVPVYPRARSHSTFMLHSMAHWQKTVHGYSGLRPALHEKLYDEMRAFPDDVAVRRLAEIGVTYVVVHGELYAPDVWPVIETKISQSRFLELMFVAGEGRIFRLKAEATHGKAEAARGEAEATGGGAEATIAGAEAR